LRDRVVGGMFAVLLIFPMVSVSEAKIWDLQNQGNTLYINILGAKKFSTKMDASFTATICKKN